MCRECTVMTLRKNNYMIKMQYLVTGFLRHSPPRPASALCLIQMRALLQVVLQSLDV